MNWTGLGNDKIISAGYRETFGLKYREHGPNLRDVGVRGYWRFPQHSTGLRLPWQEDDAGRTG
jgi:hypothetical protein